MAVTLQNVDIYTQALNSAFINAREFPQEPYPIEDALEIVPSKGEIENYPWLYPPPLMHLWNGYRQYAKIGATNYKVPNQTYTAEFEVSKENFDDEQVAGFSRKGAEMADAAREWKIIASMLNLALGQTALCFDSQPFFCSRTSGATSSGGASGFGAVGSGNNIVTGQASTGDGVTHAAVLLYTKRSVKPLLWQNREEVDFRTDMGSEIADQNRMYRFWSDLRGAAAFGFWFDACLIKWTSTPTVVDMVVSLQTADSQMRTFTYPKNLPSDTSQYFHHLTEFTNKNTLIACSSKLTIILRQVLTLSLIAQTENYFNQYAKLCTVPYLDGVV